MRDTPAAKLNAHAELAMLGQVISGWVAQLDQAMPAVRRHGSQLREAALKLGLVTAEQFDAWVRPKRMVRTDQST